jgi:hypothetical protein
MKEKITQFDRNFFDSEFDFTFIGKGSFGGKAQGLAAIRDTLSQNISPEEFPNISINIPRLTVLTTSIFDLFMKMNDLYKIAYSNERDEIIAHKFLNANLPIELTGDLRALIEKVHSPLAIRSSSLLEDAMFEPFAGIYGTKMIPNNQHDPAMRFRKLTEAIKFVYASTFSKDAKDYIKAVGKDIREEKMAIIIQEVVGNRYGDRYYPNISGVARSYNFYPAGKSKPEEGVVDLAIGLGKTIVEGGICWTYSPAKPKIQPPFGSVNDILKNTQKEFWAVYMGPVKNFNPLKETEYMFTYNLSDAEYDGTLNQVASTYDANSDSINPGTFSHGPRIINFAPILSLNVIPLNKLITRILKICEDKFGSAVEIEFAATIDKNKGYPARFGFLQVRPMVVSNEKVEISDEDYNSTDKLLSSNFVLGNGTNERITDVVYVKPELFNAKDTPLITEELEEINNIMLEERKPYLLIGFGRWGSSDPWLGIPVNWSQISGSKVIVESLLPNMNVDLSQGSHFFHNITSLQILYFSLPLRNEYKIDWGWLNSQTVKKDLQFVRHVELKKPLLIKVDGRKSKGVIIK